MAKFAQGEELMDRDAVVLVVVVVVKANDRCRIRERERLKSAMVNKDDAVDVYMLRPNEGM